MQMKLLKEREKEKRERERERGEAGQAKSHSAIHLSVRLVRRWQVACAARDQRRQSPKWHVFQFAFCRINL